MGWRIQGCQRDDDRRVQEIKNRLQPFVDAGVDRLIVPYVPVTEPVIDDAHRFVDAWGKL